MSKTAEKPEDGTANRLRDSLQHLALYVLGALHEGQMGEFLDLRLGCAGSMAAVEMLKRLDRRHHRQPRQRDSPALVENALFAGQHRFQEVGEAASLVRPPAPAPVLELELLAQGHDPIMLLPGLSYIR